MEWSDLDQAYLEIFGTHPDVGPGRYLRMVPREPIVYDAADRPDVEVLHDGTWCPGEVRVVTWVDGEERGQVQYRRPGELSSHIDDFAEDQARKDTSDRSRSRR